MFEFKLPDLGEGIHEGEVLKWHVAVGDTIAEDAPLVDIETDKAAVTIPSPRAGRVVSLAGKEGATVQVGSVIATIDDGAGAAAKPEAKAQAKAEAKPEAKPQAKPEAKPEVGPEAATPAASAQQQPVAPADPNRRVAASPATRRLARELGVDITAVPGSGPAGRVTSDDVKRFASGGGATGRAASRAAYEEDDAPVARAAVQGGGAAIPFLEIEPLPDFTAFGPVEREAVRSIRRKTARRMTTSMILVPHVALMDDCDVTTLEAFRHEENARRQGQPGGKLSMLPFVTKAVTRCLQRFPMFNASLDPHREEIVYKKYYGVGIAVDTDRGLIVPVVRDTDKKSIVEISAAIVDLATRGRDGKIEVADFHGGTFTITNIGPIGGKGLIPTINYPEVAILGMGRAEARPVVRNGEIVVRTILPLTLTFDHRIADGADAARFMKMLVGLLENPLSWLVEV